MNNKKYVAFVVQNNSDFFEVLWSDRTWERFILKYEWERSDHVKCHYEVKEGFDPSKARRCKMTREEFLKYYRENVKIVTED